MHNMRSLNLDKFSELKLIAANYDIIAITESWLTAEKEQLYNLDNFFDRSSIFLNIESHNYC